MKNQTAKSPGDVLPSAPTDTTQPTVQTLLKKLRPHSGNSNTMQKPQQKRQSRSTQARIPSQSKTPSSRSQYCRTSSPTRCSESSPAIRCSSRSDWCSPGLVQDERKTWCYSSCSQHIAYPFFASQRLFELPPKQHRKSGGGHPSWVAAPASYGCVDLRRLKYQR